MFLQRISREDWDAEDLLEKKKEHQLILSHFFIFISRGGNHETDWVGIMIISRVYGSHVQHTGGVLALAMTKKLGKIMCKLMISKVSSLLEYYLSHH